MRIFVLLFNARTDNEGLHSVKIGDRNMVLMFESEDDATRFGLMLEAQDFPTPTVEAFDSEEIEAFCQSTDYDCKLVPEGTLVMPPDANLDKTDWDPDAPPTDDDSESDQEEDSTFSEDKLAAIRRQLEGLL